MTCWLPLTILQVLISKVQAAVALTSLPALGTWIPHGASHYDPALEIPIRQHFDASRQSSTQACP